MINIPVPLLCSTFCTNIAIPVPDIVACHIGALLEGNQEHGFCPEQC
jgi:hypothetical protein